MANLTRWSPMRDMLETRRMMDRVFDSLWYGDRAEPWGNLPLVDVVEQENAVTVKAELPGFSADQIDVRIEGNMLLLKGEVRKDEEKGEGQYHIRERSMSSFQRSISLPAEVDPNKTEATFENGILTLTLAKHEHAMPKRIEIKATAPKQISPKA
jgi:HSP20 family protein